MRHGQLGGSGLWAGRDATVPTCLVVQVGPSVQLTQYGQVESNCAPSSALATGRRDDGLGRKRGLRPYRLDLTGPNGGVVRIDDIEIEDITGIYLRDIIYDAVDVRATMAPRRSDR
jgi:hypothetical protein